MSEAELSCDLQGGAHALFTTSAYGNFSSVGGEGAEHGRETRERLREQLGVCCYEVGPEVHAAFEGVHRRERHIDLKAIARDRLLAVGVTEVRDVGACTICDERFFSYRREGARAGRQGGVAWLS